MNNLKYQQTNYLICKKQCFGMCNGAPTFRIILQKLFLTGPRMDKFVISLIYSGKCLKVLKTLQLSLPSTSLRLFSFFPHCSPISRF